jgi:hypothetical protein
MTTPIPPSLERFGDDLNRAAHRELSTPSGPVRARGRRPRPRVLAGSSLGLAGVGAALVLILSGSAATAPAYAITRTGDGSVLVKLNYTSNQNLPQVNRKLAEMGTHEQITIYMAAGAATVSGPVTCSPAPSASGPPVKVLVGTNGTEVIGSGQSAGNTAEGSFHLDHCTTSGNAGSSNTGNTGTAG